MYEYRIKGIRVCTVTKGALGWRSISHVSWRKSGRNNFRTADQAMPKWCKGGEWIFVTKTGHTIRRFYDRNQRLWTVTLHDKHDNQIGHADYCPRSSGLPAAMQGVYSALDFDMEVGDAGYRVVESAPCEHFEYLVEFGADDRAKAEHALSVLIGNQIVSMGELGA